MENDRRWVAPQYGVEGVQVMQTTTLECFSSKEQPEDHRDRNKVRCIIGKLEEGSEPTKRRTWLATKTMEYEANFGTQKFESRLNPIFETSLPCA